MTMVDRPDGLPPSPGALMTQHYPPRNGWYPYSPPPRRQAPPPPQWARVAAPPRQHGPNHRPMVIPARQRRVWPWVVAVIVVVLLAVIAVSVVLARRNTLPATPTTPTWDTSAPAAGEQGGPQP